ncbi:MAG: hypothetical protein WA125_00110 [Desulfosporosinus sp.]
MNKLFVKKDKLIYMENTLSLNDLLNEELYQYSNKYAHEYESDICVVNEVFLYRIHSAIAITLFIEKNKIQLIIMEEPEDSLYPILVDVARRCNLKLSGVSNLYRIDKAVRGYISILASTGYLMWRMLVIPYSDKIDTRKGEFAIIRTPAARNKLSFLRDVNVKIEQLKDRETIYNCFGRARRISWVLKAWIRSYSELRQYKAMIKECIGISSALDAFAYYSKRVVHTLLYSYMIDGYFAMREGDTFYTGNNLDRFAIIEEQTAKRYNIKTVCIPHGLEYGFKLPHCFTCDKFYTTSWQAAKHLNALYDSEKFIYDEDIARQMFEVSSTKKEDRSIVFFTEPIEVYVNRRIIDELLPLMEKEQMQLSIKLHPKDKKSDYAQYEGRVTFVEDLNEAVSYNICFSRKSTTLLEAVYNNSVSGAILTNAKDISVFNTFPSLQDEKIKVFYSVPDLFEWIKCEGKLRNLANDLSSKLNVVK